MTLMVQRVHLAGDDWCILDDQVGDMLAGTEPCRATLWGSAALVALGCSVLPQLRGGNVYCAGSELAMLLDETQRIMAHCVAIATATGYDAAFIAHRASNIQRATAWAQANGGAVWIE